MFPLDVQAHRIVVDDQRESRARSFGAGAGPQDTVSPVSPSQQPSLNRQAGHCQVPWIQRISEPQRQQVST